MMPETSSLHAYLVDDEQLAIERLQRLLMAFPQIQIVGTATDPATAIAVLNDTRSQQIDVLFLDIQMPGINGFELLARLATQPFVIFTTAYDQHALRAFETNAIDYLLKPIEPEQLERALKKLGRIRPVTKPDWQQNPALPQLLNELTASLREGHASYPSRIAFRVGERISLLPLDDVTHFIAHEKLTFAVSNGRRHCVDQTIADLERRLDPAKFLRIHRSALVNVDWIHEVNSWFAGKVVLTLKDAQHTELTVARDRVRSLKEHLGI
ncbi:LytTR family DNA-binding domain-containing protein [Telmatobacter sp. DSM 110680]|uniref:LytTR family DNA-binding domain-containing protein n=1 Tax=Telmatobacter sp. DSM 110680 TaxID=3036704 RepID=A0AAU7DKG7_9BACT